ncbi:hypothetical protein [Rhizobium sp. OAE497]|uniref:hypothetical protein n=1 Tax=Rhizobium sp. OAE497 TaxID=2663796 RepID=UPI0018F79CD0
MSALLRFELLKLMRQPATLFWGFLSVPLLALLFRLVLEGMVFVRAGRIVTGNTDLLQSATNILTLSGNSVGHLLYAIGISSIFFSEYRFATWRHLIPRRSRLQLWTAKCLACLVCLAAGLLVAVIGDMILNSALALLSGDGPSSLSIRIAGLPALLAAFAAALLELAVLTAIVSTITILSRAMVAAVIPAFLLAIGTSMLQIYVGPTKDVLPLPSTGAEALRTWLFQQGPADAGDSGGAILLVWLIAAGGLGLFLFSRQQLSAE